MAEDRLDSIVRQALSLPPEQRPGFLAEQLGENLEARALALVKLRELEEVTLPDAPSMPVLPAVADDPGAQPITKLVQDSLSPRLAAFSATEMARLQILFEAACALPQEQQQEYIVRECGAEPLLAEALNELLAHDHALHGKTIRPLDLERLLAKTAGQFQAGAGTQLGHYSLVRQLGRGGMGTVWLAQRADGQFQRTVALKLISAGLESEAIQARFLRERQILASLSHPNIAKLLDGGLAPDGRPYFVMEYVDGEPITSYCDQLHLDVVARLRLFLQVCRAVQHAHQRLVVHRDLKPSNILVTAERMVQLLDFGIAKLLHPDLMGVAELTRPEDQAMTPRYAAPEQVRNETITTATDIYSLGVLLYELITGRLPYLVRSAGGHALEQAILDSEPRRPSLSLSDPAEGKAEVLAELRGVSLGELRQSISGDLETVVLKALKKHPAERYPSVEAFAKDLEHYLDGRPISARPDTVGYRVGKFVSRHRAGVSLVSLSFVGLLFALVISLAQTRRAEDAARRSAAVDAFLVGLFEEIDPESGDAGALRARDLLDLGAARVDSELSGDPALQGVLNAILGRLLLSTGDPQHALERLERARANDALSTPEQARLAIDYARALIASQRFEQAEGVLTEGERDAHSNPVALAQVLTTRADLQAELGRYDAAATAAEQALTLWQQAPGERQAERAQTLLTLAKIDNLRDHNEAAQAHASRALMLLRERHGDVHLDVARALERIANLQRRRGETAAAKDTLAEAMAMAEKLVGRDHLMTLAMRRLYADLLDESGELDQAEVLLNEVIADTQKRYGRYHLLRATALNSLTAIAFRRQDLAAAELAMREIIEVYRGVYGSRHNEVATVLNNLSNVVREQGRLAEARRLLDEVLEIRRETVGSEHIDYAYSLLGLARIQQLEGNSLGSAQTFAQAATIFGQAQGDQAIRRSTLVRRVHALLDHGDADLAAREMAALGSWPGGTDNPASQARRLVESWAQARIRINQADWSGARAIFAELVPLASDIWPPKDTRRIGILLDAATVYLELEEDAPAETWLKEVEESAPTLLEPRLAHLLAIHRQSGSSR